MVPPMQKPSRHVTRCVVAGIVALLPVGGAAFTIVWLEGLLSSGWLREQPFYFPGLGLLLAFLVVYGVGLLVTTFLGRWLWRRVDRTLEGMPLLGLLYQSIKEVLGYDTQRGRFFESVVLVRGEGGDEMGLVTGRTEVGGEPRTLVFVPGSPNPSHGRLLLLHEKELRRVDLRVAPTLRALVAMGKTDPRG
jgi:uncharacterized membrane protein